MTRHGQPGAGLDPPVLQAALLSYAMLRHAELRYATKEELVYANLCRVSCYGSMCEYHTTYHHEVD